MRTPFLCAASPAIACLSLLLIGLASAPNALAEGSTASASSTFPKSPIGVAAQELFTAINSGEDASIDAFANRYLTSTVVGPGGSQWPRERCVKMLHKLKSQSGGLSLVRLRADEGKPGYLVAMFDAKLTDPWIAIEFESHPQQYDRLHRIELHVMFPPPSPPETGTLQEQHRDADGLATAIQSRVQGEVDRDRFSGVVLVAKGDEIVLHQAWGMADRERDIANTSKTRFNTASVGKMFTGVAIGQLVEQGKLSFSDTLAAILPEYPNREVADRVTLHHLLTHTSGLGDPFLSPHRIPSEQYSTAWANIKLFSDQPLAFEPGTRHEYSNGNYAVLAAVVEKLTQQTFGNYVRQHIYNKAGMGAADVAAYQQQPRAIGYTHPPDSDPLALEPREANTDVQHSLPTSDMSGFGGYNLTAEDLFRFFRALREHRLLGPQMTETVTTGKVEVMPGAPVRYAYGFYDQRFKGTAVRGHSGGGGHMGYGAHAELLWDQDVTVVVLGNYDLDYVRPVAMTLVDFLSRQ